MTSICIDGFNLSLPKGTGIATYGRNLLDAAVSAGFSTQVLYGPSAPRNGNNVVNETALIDAPRNPSGTSLNNKFSRFLQTRASSRGRNAFSIRPSDEVIWPAKGGGRPVATCFWAAQNLYYYANRSFAAYGKETPVRFLAEADTPRPDVMHWTATLPLYAKSVPNIYTIHDLIPLRLPHTTMDDKATYKALCDNIVKHADHIAVVSETTRQDVIRILGVSEDRVTNTYQAVKLPAQLTQRSQLEVVTELEGIFNLGWKNYFLHFGSVEPKKNLGRIAEAYLASGIKTPLVVVGGKGWLEEGELALIKQVKSDGGSSANRIRQYEYLPFSMLISLIRGAKATLFPSLYEGFGLPVLESMALGTAVLTSTGGSLPEVAGDAAVIVDPYDVQAMTRGIQALDLDESLRSELERLGHARAELFTPEAYQRQLVDLYAKIGITV